MVALLSDRRAQTTQDYAMGMALFLIALLFVLTFIPAVLAPFADVDHRERAAQAERASLGLIGTTAIEGERVHLDADELETLLAEEDLAEELGLRADVRINVTLTGLDGDEAIVTGGTSPGQAETGVWTRIVTTTDDACEPACRLTVRVW